MHGTKTPMTGGDGEVWGSTFDGVVVFVPVVRHESSTIGQAAPRKKRVGGSPTERRTIAVKALALA